MLDKRERKGAHSLMIFRFRPLHLLSTFVIGGVGLAKRSDASLPTPSFSESASQVRIDLPTLPTSDEMPKIYSFMRELRRSDVRKSYRIYIRDLGA